MARKENMSKLSSQNGNFNLSATYSNINVNSVKPQVPYVNFWFSGASKSLHK